MKYSILIVLNFLVSSIYASEEQHETPRKLQASVGEIVSFPVCNADKLTNMFHNVDKAPNELILQFVKNEETKNEDSSRSMTAKYLALQPGITAVRFGLYAQSLCKSLGFVSFTVEVK